MRDIENENDWHINNDELLQNKREHKKKEKEKLIVTGHW
jgi:hypothetical protein